MKLFKLSILAAALVGTLVACNKNDAFLGDSLPNDLTANATGSGTSTGQGIMVDFQVDANYVINEEMTYHFDAQKAKDEYMNVQVSSVPTAERRQGTCDKPTTTPSAPAANPIGIGDATSNKCVFFNGSTSSTVVKSYEKFVDVVTGSGSNRCVWRFTWKYDVVIKPVEKLTAWSSEITVPGVDPVVPINATIAGLSALSSKQHPLKYSFGLLADDGISSRITDLKVIVDGNEIAAPANSIISGTDFVYTTNAGSSGSTGLLAGTDGQLASWILSSASGDTFSGNDGASNIVCAKMDQVITTLGEGTHTITVTAVVKGNSAVADASIKVTKNVTISGACNN